METVSDVLPYLIGGALAAVVLVLFAGIFSLARGGEFARRHGNRIMRARVALQAVAVLLMLAFWLVARG
jgi:hypothetical protein